MRFLAVFSVVRKIGNLCFLLFLPFFFFSPVSSFAEDGVVVAQCGGYSGQRFQIAVNYNSSTPFTLASNLSSYSLPSTGGSGFQEFVFYAMGTVTNAGGIPLAYNNLTGYVEVTGCVAEANQGGEMLSGCPVSTDVLISFWFVPNGITSLTTVFTNSDSLSLPFSPFQTEVRLKAFSDANGLVMVNYDAGYIRTDYPEYFPIICTVSSFDWIRGISFIVGLFTASAFVFASRMIL